MIKTPKEKKKKEETEEETEEETRKEVNMKRKNCKNCAIDVDIEWVSILSTKGIS